MSFSDYELETDAIDKCSRCLERLDNRTKLRVIRYLVDRFGLVPPSEAQSEGTVTQNINFQQNNLVLPSPHEISNQPPVAKTIMMIPSEALLKGYTKKESDLLLLLCYYYVSTGHSTFTRQNLLDEYKNHNLFNESRRSNCQANMKKLIKRSLIKPLNAEDYSITDQGRQVAEQIMSGKLVDEDTKPTRKRRAKKAIKAESLEAVPESEPVVDGQA